MTDIPIPAKVYDKPTLTYMGKAIGEMTDQELIDNSFKLERMLKETEEKRKDPRFLKKMQGQTIPPINPHFMNVRAEIDKELDHRGIAK